MSNPTLKHTAAGAKQSPEVVGINTCVAGDVSPALSLPVKPKRHLSGYLLFCCQMRDMVKTDLRMDGQEPTAKAVTAELGRLWMEAPDAYKAKWNERSRPAKEQYEAAMKRYEAEVEEYVRLA